MNKKGNKEKIVTDNGYIDLDIDTQNEIKQIIKAGEKLEIELRHYQEVINTIIISTVRALKKKGNYKINKNITRLELIKEEKK